MDTVFWVILIIAVVGVIWWLLNRGSTSKPRQEQPREPQAGDARGPGEALPSGTAAASGERAGTAGPGSSAVPPAPAAAGPKETPRDGHRQDRDEWETQWSEAAGAPAVRTSAAAAPAAAPASEQPAAQQPAAGQPKAGQEAPAAGHNQGGGRPVHHPEYTGPHAPTLPGAESAAVEEADDDGTSAGARGTFAAGGQPAAGAPPQEATPEPRTATASTAVPEGAAAMETQDRTQSSALVESGADHSVEDRGDTAPDDGGGAAEPAGHLAADEPYGVGSAPAAADGTGPADYGVKGDAAGMVYYEEGHPEYGQVRADVWFESAAHAEAAGFRAPRRRRL